MWRTAVAGSVDDLFLEFVQDEDSQGEMRVASNDSDNRAAWPIAFAILGRLSELYDATEEPRDEDSLN